MSDLFPVTVPEMVKAVEREISLRRRVYPRRVADRKMTQETADKEISVMEAVLVFLKERQ